MSASKYFKNFILCGDAELHCLLCNETFLQTVDLEKHVRWEQHRKLLKNQCVLPKFKNDSIFKIRHYHYCQFCNYLTEDSIAIKTHVESQEHKELKNNPGGAPFRFMAKHENDSVVIKNIIIKKQQWHGIINKQCGYCNMAVNNVSDHIKMQNHVIKLIQTELICIDGDLFKKVNDLDMQCFKCKKIFSNSIEEHLEYHKSNINNNNISEQDTKSTSCTNDGTKMKLCVCDTAASHKVYDKKYDLEHLNVTEDIFYDIDLKNKKVTCKTCKLEVEVTSTKLMRHLLSHNNYKSEDSALIKAIQKDIDNKYTFIPHDHGKARSETAKYGRLHEIKMNAGGSKGYCTLCDKFLSAHVKVFKSHVEGANHQGHLELKGLIKPKKHEKLPFRTSTLYRFLSTLCYSSSMKAFWINASFVTNGYSFLLIKRIEHGPHFKKTKCFACEESFLWDKEKEHCMTKNHKLNFMKAHFVGIENQFVREIRPNLFHCGFCNESIPYYEMVQRHLANINHDMRRLDQIFVRALTLYVETYGTTPDSVLINKVVENDAMYTQLIKVVFGI